MKKLLFVLSAIVLGVIFSTGNAVSAKTPKLFKNGCFRLDGAGFLNNAHLFLATKKSGMKLRDSDNRITFYSVTGGIWVTGVGFPLSGSGYLDYGGPAYTIEISGMYSQSSFRCTLNFRTEAGIDTASCYNESDVYYSYNLIEEDCRSTDFDHSE